LRSAGFEHVQMQAHPFCTNEYDSETYGVALIPLIGSFVAGRGGLTEDDVQTWIDEQRGLGAREEFYFASTQFCFTASNPIA
jgi:hypothetical protein